MDIKIRNKPGVKINDGMIGLFFEDINYAADGGLYAEMIENRSFEFLKATGDYNDYTVEYDGGYAWSGYPDDKAVNLRLVSGSPLSTQNPHYLRLSADKENTGIANKAYDGIYLKKEMEYNITFFARSIQYKGSFEVLIEKGGKQYGSSRITVDAGEDETYNRFKKYSVKLKAEDSVQGATFVLRLKEPGVVEFDFISMFPEDAVEGVFRKDLFDKLAELKPGFIRFPGGCIIEGNTLDNRYRYKDSLTQPWNRKSNWNRWAVHGTNKDNCFTTEYAHYNQTMGLGFYEYFLLCEKIGAKALPVLNVGLACQYQSQEFVAIDSPQFQEYIQDALDLIEFANGGIDTKWGAVRKELGHEEPFQLSMLGIGNEQWQTDKVDFFERYQVFEKAIHKKAPDIALIGSAGPDITSERYKLAWDFYHTHEEDPNFVYAVDEHYYVKPEWLFEHTDFYDNYDRKVKVFSGEYAAHPFSGMNRPDANNLIGALAEAAFLTGLERNADVVLLASYAPLFARIGYSQWSPDMIWFNDAISYGTPSYYVQKLYAGNMGTVTLATEGEEKEAAKEKIYYTLSYDERTSEIILKVVNSNHQGISFDLKLDQEWLNKKTGTMTIMTGSSEDSYNSVEYPDKILPYEISVEVDKTIQLPPLSFSIMRIGE